MAGIAGCPVVDELALEMATGDRDTMAAEGNRLLPDQARSMIIAMPWPTPMHIVHSA
jgi:hypothetical protein